MIESFVVRWLTSRIEPRIEVGDFTAADRVQYDALIDAARIKGLDPETVRRLIEVLGRIAIIFLRIYLGAAK